MEDITVRCVCGRAMRVLATQGPGHYRCANCRTRVHVSIPVIDPDPTRCGITIESRRCTGKRVLDLEVCGLHLNDILVEGLNDPATREHVIERIGRQKVAEETEKVRRRLQMEQAMNSIRAKAMRPDCPVVYYVQLAEDRIKIGTTIHLATRMDRYRLVSKDQVLAAEPGGQRLEKKRHYQFGHLRIHTHREDFRPGADLMDHIAAIRTQHGPPYEMAERMLTEARALAEARHHQ